MNDAQTTAPQGETPPNFKLVSIDLLRRCWSVTVSETKSLGTRFRKVETRIDYSVTSAFEPEPETGLGADHMAACGAFKYRIVGRVLFRNENGVIALSALYMDDKTKLMHFPPPLPPAPGWVQPDDESVIFFR